MPKKIRVRPDSSSIPGRVAWYLEKVWRGSKTAMGEDTGIHPSSIGNVIHGRRVPGREILTAIGAHPLVNSAWLMHGTGKPIQTDGLGIVSSAAEANGKSCTAVPVASDSAKTLLPPASSNT